MHRRSEISPVASCLVHEEKLSPFYMFHKIKFIEQCNFVITFILSEKTMAGLEGGGVDGPLDSETCLFILDSSQLEAAVGSNELFISCHVLGSVDAMLRFIHAVGLLKLAVLVPVHACTQQHYGVCMWYVPTLAYLWYLVQLAIHPSVRPAQ